MTVAMTVDIVGSRALPDRQAAQHALDAATSRVHEMLPVAVSALRPTVGDELQGVYRRLEDAMAVSLLLQLTLPEGLECRFGLGVGAVGEVPSTSGPIPDGPGWWAAREAIDTVHALARRTAPPARTRIAASVEASRDERAHVRLGNAYLLVRDELVAAMSERTRRLTLGRCLSRTQRDLAQAEGITQSAVSQALTAAGAASVVEGFRLLTAER